MDEIQETQARITFEDVKQAVEDMSTTPQDTNASAVRRHMGRGGNTTIQKHLDQLRATHIEQAAPEDRVEPPKETLNHLWNAAVTAAKATMATRVDKVIAERETATAAAAQAIKDRDSAFADAEQWEAQAQEAKNAVRELEGHNAGMQTEHLEQLVNIQNSRAEVFNENAELKHTIEVLRLAHQIEMDRLIQQISDLKVILYREPNSQNATVSEPALNTPNPETKKKGKPAEAGNIGGTGVAD
jgi:hypothetical protein